MNEFSAVRPESSSDIPKSNLKQWQPILLLGLLTIVAAAYWRGLDGGFAFDDNGTIISNPALQVHGLAWRTWIAAIFSGQAGEFQRPIAMLSFAINEYFTGLNPWPMKLTNLAIHLCNTLLVFGLSRSLIRVASPPEPGRGNRLEWAALAVAGFWSLNPINLMAVLYIVQRMESLCHMFVFAGLWMYVSGRTRQMSGLTGWGRIMTGLLVGTTIGILTKESAALLPLYALCLELLLFHFRRNAAERDTRFYALYLFVLVLPGLFGLAWLWPRVMGPDWYSAREFTLGQRLLTEPRVVLDYLRWTVLPNIGQLSIYHDDYVASRGLLAPPATLAGLLGVPVMLLLAWICRHRRPLISLGLLWFLAAQLLTATIIPLELVFEHRNYFASLGVCLALADIFLLMPARRSLRVAGRCLSVLFLLFFGGITHLRAIEWSNPVRFAWSEVQKHPQSPRATFTFANMMMIMSGYKADSPFVADTWQALERARRVPQSGLLPVQSMLVFAARTNAPLQPDWWKELQGKLSQRPAGPQELLAMNNLTQCAIEGRCDFPKDEMLMTFSAALSTGPNPEALNIYANYAVLVLDDSDLALNLWRDAVRLSPRTAQYHRNLAELLITLKRYGEAREQIGKLRELGWFGQNEVSADALQRKIPSAGKVSG